MRTNRSARYAVAVIALDHATASLDAYGPARVAWQREGDRVVVEADVPPNTTAQVVLQCGEPITVDSGAHEWTVDSVPPSGA